MTEIRRMARLEATFGALVVAQAAHSVEEYVGRLWESFPPAALLTGLVSSNRETGFLVVNAALIGLAVWSFLVPVRRRWPSAATLVRVWIVIETINGIGHALWTLLQRGYTPGVATAPALVGLSVYLASQLRRGAARQATPR